MAEVGKCTYRIQVLRFSPSLNLTGPISGVQVKVAAELGGSRPQVAAADGVGAGDRGQSEMSAPPVGEPSGAPD